MSKRATPRAKTPKASVDERAATVYADTIIGMTAGAYTSRIVLACEDGQTSEKVPVMTLVMPTQALYSVAVHIVATLTNPETRKNMMHIHKMGADLMSDSTAAIKSYSELLATGESSE